MGFRKEVKFCWLIDSITFSLTPSHFSFMIQTNFRITISTSEIILSYGKYFQLNFTVCTSNYCLGTMLGDKTTGRRQLALNCDISLITGQHVLRWALGSIPLLPTLSCFLTLALIQEITGLPLLFFLLWLWLWSLFEDRSDHPVMKLFLYLGWSSQWEQWKNTPLMAQNKDPNIHLL